MFATISIKEIDSYIENKPNMMLVDLRDPASYGRAHLDGAVNLPYQELEGRLYEIPKNKTLVFYCARGGQSMAVCRYLDRLGYTVVDVVGGIMYYRGKYLVRG